MIMTIDEFDAERSEMIARLGQQTLNRNIKQFFAGATFLSESEGIAPLTFFMEEK